MKVEEDSKALFEIALGAITNDPNLNVVIVKRLARFDRTSKDISGVKAQLSKFANGVYDQLWLKQGSPERIHIVELALGCENYPHLKNIIYGQPSDSKYDGIHPNTAAASRHFTYRAVQAILPVISPQSKSKPKGQFRTFKSHFRAENGAENRVKDVPNLTGRRRETNKHSHGQHHQSAKVSHGERSSDRKYSDVLRNRYNVPTSNLYDHLNY